MSNDQPGTGQPSWQPSEGEQQQPYGQPPVAPPAPAYGQGYPAAPPPPAYGQGYPAAPAYGQGYPAAPAYGQGYPAAPPTARATRRTSPAPSSPAGDRASARTSSTT